MTPAPVFSHHAAGLADEHLRRQIHWLLFLRVLFLSLMLGASVILQATRPSGFLPSLNNLAYFIAWLYLLTILSALGLRMVRRYSRFGYLQISLDTLLVTLLVMFSGGSQSVFTVVYFFPIVMGAFMLFRQGSLLFASLCSLLFGAVLFMEYSGNATRFLKAFPGPPSDPQTLLHLFTIYCLTFFLVAILSSMLSGKLQKTEAQLFQATTDYDRLSSLYKQIFEDISAGIITIDAVGRITSCNRVAAQITGYGQSELSGRYLAETLPGLTRIVPDQGRHTTTIFRKNGEIIPVGYSSSRLNTPEHGAVYTLQDLSLIKKMEAQVQQAEKMATIGEMAAGIAHELRNPLAAISGSVQLLDLESGTDPANKKLFAIILREADRLDTTVHEFLLFSRPINPEKEWFLLLPLVREAIETLRQDPGWDQVIGLKLEIDEKLECWGDPQLIRQVLINLIGNSGNACRNISHGEIAVRAKEQADDQAESISLPAHTKLAELAKNIKSDGLPQEINRLCSCPVEIVAFDDLDKLIPEEGEQEEAVAVIIEVSDNGPGVAEELKEKIFAPFFTTRENGTGLGLAIVSQIVHSHGGEIYVNNQTNGGAIFSVRLPLP